MAVAPKEGVLGSLKSNKKNHKFQGGKSFCNLMYPFLSHRLGIRFLCWSWFLQRQNIQATGSFWLNFIDWVLGNLTRHYPELASARILFKGKSLAMDVQSQHPFPFCANEEEEVEANCEEELKHWFYSYWKVALPPFPDSTALMLSLCWQKEMHLAVKRIMMW